MFIYSLLISKVHRSRIHWLIAGRWQRREGALQRRTWCALAPSSLQLQDQINAALRTPLTALRSLAAWGVRQSASTEKGGWRKKNRIGESLKKRIWVILLLVGGIVERGTIGLTLPRSHLRACQVTLSDSVTMANNLTKAIVLSSPSPGQISDQSEFI